MKLEDLLSNQQKTALVTALIQEHEKRVPFSLKYDRRFGWDFEVRASGTKPVVIFSVSVDSPRLPFAVREAARAIGEIKRTGTTAIAIGKRFAFASGIILLAEGEGVILRGQVPEPVALVVRKAQTPVIWKGVSP